MCHADGQQGECQHIAVQLGQARALHHCHMIIKPARSSPELHSTVPGMHCTAAVPYNISLTCSCCSSTCLVQLTCNM